MRNKSELAGAVAGKLITLFFFCWCAFALITYFFDWATWVNTLLAFLAGRIMIAIVDTAAK